MKLLALIAASVTGLSSLGMAYYAPPPWVRQLREVEAVAKNQELREAFKGDAEITSITRGEMDDSGTRYYVQAGHCTAMMRVLPISIALDPSRLESRFEGMACE